MEARKPTVCFKFEVEKVVGVSSDGRYQVQWAPCWVSKFHLIDCDHLIQEFLREEELVNVNGTQDDGREPSQSNNEESVDGTQDDCHERSLSQKEGESVNGTQDDSHDPSQSQKEEESDHGMQDDSHDPSQSQKEEESVHGMQDYSHDPSQSQKEEESVHGMQDDSDDPSQSKEEESVNGIQDNCHDQSQVHKLSNETHELENYVSESLPVQLDEDVSIKGDTDGNIDNVPSEELFERCAVVHLGDQSSTVNDISCPAEKESDKAGKNSDDTGSIEPPLNGKGPKEQRTDNATNECKSIDELLSSWVSQSKLSSSEYPQSESVFDEEKNGDLLDLSNNNKPFMHELFHQNGGKVQMTSDLGIHLEDVPAKWDNLNHQLAQMQLSGISSDEVLTSAELSLENALCNLPSTFELASVASEVVQTVSDKFNKGSCDAEGSFLSSGIKKFASANDTKKPKERQQSENQHKSNALFNSNKKFTCIICKLNLPHPVGLGSHVKIHLKGKCWECPDCSYTTTHSYLRLKSHYQSHTNPYPCNHCPKSFNRSEHLQKHIRTHSGAKPYSCSYCEKTFARKYTLTIHERAHTGVRPYKCNDCKKCFKDRSALRYHIRSFHTDQRPHVCEHCGKRFLLKTGLKYHQTRNICGAPPTTKYRK